MTELQSLLHDLGSARAWVELLVLLACVALAYGVARFAARGHTPDSVWFGRRVFDGLLFPVLALLLIYAARHGVALYQPVAVLKVALPVFISLAAIRLFVRVLGASYPKSPTVQLIESLVSWLAWGGAVLWITGLLFVLSAVGVDLTALSVLGGAVGVGLGFGLQKLAANYVSGFVILLERSLRIGDSVKVDGFEGVVTDIKTRFTLIRAADGRESIVPNELIMTQRVENLSLADSRVLLTLQVAVGYGSDVARVREILCAAAAASARVLKDPAPAAYLANFGADGLEFTLAVWIGDPDKGQLSLRSEINERILSGLREAGIDIPYPQRVVYMKS